MSLNLMNNEETLSREKTVVCGWDLYKNGFSDEEKIALRTIISKKFGIDLGAVRRKFVSDFLKDKSASAMDKYGICLVYSSPEIYRTIQDFLETTAARLGCEGDILGKSGMIFEGFSGVGKDMMLLYVLDELGYVNGYKVPDAPAHKKYYVFNANPARVDELVKLIRKTQKEGSIVIIREMNLLRSAFIEGKLNDVLTGSAKAGFALFATINSIDYSRRESFSIALLNRVIYYRVPDHRQEDLLNIALARANYDRIDDVNRIVSLHCWIRQSLTRKNLYPTTREINKTVDLLLSGMSFAEASAKVYGQFYLKRALKQDMPDDTFLDEFTEEILIDKIAVLRNIAHLILPARLRPIDVIEDPYVKGGAVYSARDNAVIVGRNDPLAEQIEYVYEVSLEGLFHRYMPCLSLDENERMFGLYRKLEEIRLKNAISVFFKDDADIRTIRREDLKAYLLHELFVDKDDKKAELAEILADEYLEQVNIFLNCIPDSLSEKDILISAFESLRAFKKIDSDLKQRCDNAGRTVRKMLDDIDKKILKVNDKQLVEILIEAESMMTEHGLRQDIADSVRILSDDEVSELKSDIERLKVRIRNEIDRREAIPSWAGEIILWLRKLPGNLMRRVSAFLRGLTSIFVWSEKAKARITAKLLNFEEKIADGLKSVGDSTEGLSSWSIKTMFSIIKPYAEVISQFNMVMKIFFWIWIGSLVFLGGWPVLVPFVLFYAFIYLIRHIVNKYPHVMKNLLESMGPEFVGEFLEWMSKTDKNFMKEMLKKVDMKDLSDDPGFEEFLEKVKENMGDSGIQEVLKELSEEDPAAMKRLLADMPVDFYKQALDALMKEKKSLDQLLFEHMEKEALHASIEELLLSHPEVLYEMLSSIPESKLEFIVLSHEAETENGSKASSSIVD
ncbi:hypothetical protein GF406_11020, partial [candidate division KSB1 bacterium]|nr:hypothetical protein [candidate division KSB1 bacterium]